MVKKAFALLAVLSIVLCLCSCGQDTDKDISMYDLQKAMLEADGELPEMLTFSSSEDGAEDAFSYISDLDYSKVKSFFLAYASDGMAYEIAVIQLKNSADAGEAAETLEAHRQDRINLYKTYEPDQVPKAESAVVKAVDNFAVLIMCGNQTGVEKAFTDFIK